MRPQIKTHKAKIWQLCFFLALCLHLECGAAPGSCKHSVTEDHLNSLDHLIGNQVLSGCSITYNFTEHQNLSEVCYIKAAFPYILDLLKTHFTYRDDSDNYKYTSSLERLYYNIYSQQCIPSIDEAIEENPVKFARLYTSSPVEALAKAKLVIQMYRNLMTKNEGLVEWNCEDEYAKDFEDSSFGDHNETTDLEDKPTVPSSGMDSEPTKVPSSSTGSSPTQSAFQLSPKSNPSLPSDRYTKLTHAWKSSDTKDPGTPSHFLSKLIQSDYVNNN
ncbi:macrophage colony-stimulating factor 1a [Trichomycterus rosablanca]|uniref:macrophage colony-stimulating factor 1a n=1 Tax=Trichomycterus rosablanca TaxID=2290929 RepID=UPI002F358099